MLKVFQALGKHSTFGFIVFSGSIKWEHCPAMGQSTCFYFIFTAKQLRQSLSFNKVAGLRHKCFPVNFQKFLRTPPDDYFFTVLTIVKYINKWTQKAKKNNTLVSRNVSDEKNLHSGGRKMFFINLIQFSKQILHLKTTLTVIFFFEKQRGSVFYCLKGKM